MRAFPGIISAQRVFPGELLAYTNPRLAAEEGAKANPGGAAERCRNAGLGTALDAQYATGTAADRFAQVKERAVEAAAAVEGDTQVGASTAERMHRCLAMPGPSTFSMKNRLQTIFGVRISDRFMPLILLIFAANI